MATLSSVTSQLLDELARTGQLTSQAHTYINQAIKHYQNKTFWFSEKRVEFTASAGQEYYDLTTDFATMYNLRVSIGVNNVSDTASTHIQFNNPNTYPLRFRTNNHMDDLFIAAANYTGYPQDYSIFNRQVRLGPVPNLAHKLTMTYKRRPEQLSATGATNVLINNADDLVIARAGKLMAGLILQDMNRAQAFAIAEKEALQMHRADTNEYQMTGHTKRRK